MQGWVSIIAASAVLSAGLVAGLAAADAAAKPAAGVSAPAVAWNDPPARPAPLKAETVNRETAGASAEPLLTCSAAAWPYLPAGCAAGARPVRVIALGQR